MGREVASAYRRRKDTFASLSPSPSRLSSATNSSMESLSSGSKDNLTPARKHHKLLKDGSEVWSKDVEKIFVEGLREYWQSPWATYSRGRSRWRNQFLVDHLKKAGIERTKKQVASHIQVLRNMWRGQPEFHLVAGGEELFQENGLLAYTNKKSNTSPSPSVSPSRVDLHESPAASSASTPEYPTSEFPADIPTASFPSLSPPSQVSPFSDLGVEDVFSSPPSSTHLPDPGFGCVSSSPRTTHPITPVPVKLEPLAMDPTLFTLPQTSYADSAADYTLSVPNRISHLYFWADGMVPLTLDVDQLVGATASSPSRTFLHLRVSMPPLADLRCPPNLQGVNGAVSFATSWSNLAKCQTKSWGPGRTVMNQELGLFTQVTTPELQTTLAADPSSPQAVYAYLPDSALSRCHWLDNVQTITQQIVVDNEVLAVLVYHIERVPDGTRSAPGMELIGFQKYPWRGASLPPPLSSASSSSTSTSTSASSSYQLFAALSPPVSPTSPSFTHVHAHAHGHGHGHAYASAPISPPSPLFPRSSIPSGGGSGAEEQMMYPYPPPQPYSYSPYAIDPRRA